MHAAMLSGSKGLVPGGQRRRAAATPGLHAWLHSAQVLQEGASSQHAGAQAASPGSQPVAGAAHAHQNLVSSLWHRGHAR